MLINGKYKKVNIKCYRRIKGIVQETRINTGEQFKGHYKMFSQRIIYFNKARGFGMTLKHPNIKNSLLTHSISSGEFWRGLVTILRCV